MTKFCKDCVHCNKWMDTCRHPVRREVELDFVSKVVGPVYSRTYDSDVHAIRNHRPRDPCGAEGKQYSPKITVRLVSGIKAILSGFKSNSKGERA